MSGVLDTSPFAASAATVDTRTLRIIGAPSNGPKSNLVRASALKVEGHHIGNAHVDQDMEGDCGYGFTRRAEPGA